MSAVLGNEGVCLGGSCKLLNFFMPQLLKGIQTLYIRGYIPRCLNCESRSWYISSFELVGLSSKTTVMTAEILYMNTPKTEFWRDRRGWASYLVPNFKNGSSYFMASWTFKTCNSRILFLYLSQSYTKGTRAPSEKVGEQECCLWFICLGFTHYVMARFSNMFSNIISVTCFPCILSSINNFLYLKGGKLRLTTRIQRTGSTFWCFYSNSSKPEKFYISSSRCDGSQPSIGNQNWAVLP